MIKSFTITTCRRTT